MPRTEPGAVVGVTAGPYSRAGENTGPAARMEEVRTPHAALPYAIADVAVGRFVMRGVH
jgi:hypothetical protein